MDMEAVYMAHFERVYRFLLGLCRNSDLAEELTQQTFERAMRRSSTFNGRCEISTWLCGIARNCFIDHYRRQKRETPADPLPEAAAPDFTDALLDRETALRVHRALHALEEPIRRCFPCAYSGSLITARSARCLAKAKTGRASPTTARRRGFRTH